LRERLEQAGVATGLHYPCPVHLQPAYSGLGYGAGEFPVSERLAGELLSLPIYPELTLGQQEYISGLLHGGTSGSPVAVRRSGHRPAAALDPTGRLAGKRCLVTGGACFIGSQIVDRLVEAGCAEIVVLDNMVRGRRCNIERAMASGRVQLVEGDIRDAATIRDVVAGADTVFHQAALRITQCADEPRAAFDVMVAATYELVETCVQAGVRKLVMASSASVYGMAQQFPTTERQNPYDNRTLYGAAKAFGEGLLRSFNETTGLDYVALRYFNVYGPRMDVHGRYTEVLVRWMERLDAGQPPIIFGDGLQTMDMIHVEDVARANIAAAVADATDVALNVGSGTETSLLDLACALARVMERPAMIPVFQPTRAVNPVPRRLAGTGEAKRRIGFTAEIPIEEGLADLVRWWRNTLAPAAA
jgi:UDP-glucose 4-epimerase